MSGEREQKLQVIQEIRREIEVNQNRLEKLFGESLKEGSRKGLIKRLRWPPGRPKEPRVYKLADRFK